MPLQLWWGHSCMYCINMHSHWFQLVTASVFTFFYCALQHWMICLAYVNVQPRTKYDSQEAGKIHISHTSMCMQRTEYHWWHEWCVSMVTVHVVWGLFPLMRFALETNVPPALSTGLSWLWGCREKRGRDGNITQLEDFSVWVFPWLQFMLFPLMRFALETNVPPALSTGFLWL